jgi:anti-sigma factor RsiW
VTDVPPEEPPADPRDALIRAQAERIAALEAMVAELREQLAAVVFQHVPVERCRELIADVARAAVSEGFIHSCLARAASLAGEVVALIRALITASAVAGFDETTLRSGPAGRSGNSSRDGRSGGDRGVLG